MILRYWWNRFLSTWHNWPSWRIVYADGVSYPLRYEDARTRCELYDGLCIKYSRDAWGDLL